jgi:D-alanyl-lipoteichoic acid acyltransferase DltB (MBOAT superfamily)
MMFAGFAAWVCLSALIRRFLGGPFSPARKLFLFITSLATLYFLHGRAGLIPIAICVVHFAIAKVFGGTRLAPLTAWTFNTAVLLSMYFTSGYSRVHALAWLFAGGGQLLRWHTVFKIAMLRMLSFSMDYHWALCQVPPNPAVAKHSELERQQETPRPVAQYDFVTFFVYCFYLPLYIAGPIVTYNAFVAQLETPQKTVPLWKAIRGVGLVALYAVCFDVCNHYFYMNGINENRWWYDGLNPSEIAAMALYMMNWMWMKFLIIWRFFRLFAVLDGIDSHENMPRCISMISRPSVMWRSWHASFNVWAVRYLYVPLGGRRWQWLTAWLIFIYIAMWHDIEVRWLAWAVINCAGLFIEGAITTTVGKSPRFEWLRAAWYYRHLQALGSAVSIYLLIVANLAISHGFEHTPALVRLFLFAPGALKAFAITFSVLFAAGHLQMEIRAEEARHNHAKRY